MSFTVHNEDCLTGMGNLAECSVDSFVTDPPYGLTFMGKGWDRGVPGSPFWEAALRAAKPGAHLLAFGGTRTFHQLTCAIEDAGWEIRDCLMWVYGSGFPKSLDVSKAIDKAAGAEREVVGHRTYAGGHIEHSNVGKLSPPIGTFVRAQDRRDETAPAPAPAHQWQGWGTALKPAWEPIILARKPIGGTVAANVQEWGTGALNVDGCRVGFANDADKNHTQGAVWRATKNETYGKFHDNGEVLSGKDSTPDLGRWPANLIHDGSEEVLGLFPSPHGAGAARGGGLGTDGRRSMFVPNAESNGMRFGDSGSAARFFYCAKASKADREDGNNHPTVKPTALMRYLCRLITPPNGTICDPFTGSGSTGKAALLEGFRFIGFELEAEYAAIARARCHAVNSSQPLLSGVPA